MNKILLRIFVGLASVITVLGFFIVVFVGLVNDVRKEHYFHDMANAALGLYDALEMSSVYVTNENHEDAVKRFDLSSIERERLQYGQSIVKDSGGLIVALRQSESRGVVWLEFDSSATKLYELYVDISRQVLGRVHNSGSSSSVLDDLSEVLQVSYSKLNGTEMPFQQSVLDSIADVGAAHVLNDDGFANESYFRLVTGELYQIKYHRQYSSYSWWVFCFLLIVSVALVMLFAYYFVEGVSRRLRAIEAAASRLSRGELEARVPKASDDDAISRVGAAFNSMADHIQRLMYVQKEMIHAVSHELRTPVARIRFGVQMIEDCPSPEALNKQVRGIDGDIQELDELIDEILTYARLEQGGPILAFQEADVAAIVEQVISEQSSVKPDMQIFAEFKEGSDVWKMSDVETRYIHRSIQNLVGNATRYAEGKVKVVCAFDSDTCRIDVEDDGPGIPEDQWESVFTPFARLDDSRTRSSGGYGLGLSIVRRILYWHGGQAFLGRSTMGGAKFSLVWPRRQDKA